MVLYQTNHPKRIDKCKRKKEFKKIKESYLVLAKHIQAKEKFHVGCIQNHKGTWVEYTANLQCYYVSNHVKLKRDNVQYDTAVSS